MGMVERIYEWVWLREYTNGYGWENIRMGMIEKIYEWVWLREYMNGYGWDNIWMGMVERIYEWVWLREYTNGYGWENIRMGMVERIYEWRGEPNSHYPILSSVIPHMLRCQLFMSIESYNSWRLKGVCDLQINIYMYWLVSDSVQATHLPLRTQ
jgi:hypothetical protein